MTRTDFISLDQNIDRENSDDSNQTYMEVVASNEDLENNVLNKLTAEALDKAISECLTREEEMVLRERFGLNEDQTVIAREDIAKKYGLTLTDVRMRERMTKKKLAKVKELKGLI